jgi:hypothetical protein
LKRFLICSADEPVNRWKPSAVMAENESQALRKYLSEVFSKSKSFREYVQDLAPNMSFVERFYLASDQESDRFLFNGSIGTEMEIVYSRVLAYFEGNPPLGARFLDFMKSANADLLGDDIYEYIALSTSASDHGLVVLDPDAVAQVA